MRGSAESHRMMAPQSLRHALELMAAEPGQWTPFGGGTEIMVAHAAGKLAPSRFLSLWGLPELRFIQFGEAEVSIGAATTFTDIREDPQLGAEFPLLARAASWIGSIANQNRATVGGNIVNGSPAADSAPALLVYDAELELGSSERNRRVPYRDFHIGYKRNLLAPDELVLAIHLPRRFAGHRHYLRKVGTRRAMAISKIALAGSARLDSECIAEIRLAAASVAAYPTRLFRAEDALQGQPLTPATIEQARSAMSKELLPIDDIRSTSAYRQRVALNLLEEFLMELKRGAPA